MTNFPKKTFNGTTYEFTHLAPVVLHVPVNTGQIAEVTVHVTFGCHCFTESFNPDVHQDHHRYTHLNELRAFDVERFQCSLQLPQVVSSMLGGRVYHADESFTYVAQITLPPGANQQSYSIFFSLRKDHRATAPTVKMYIKSAYLRNLASKSQAQSWRFAALVGTVAEVYPKKTKPSKPSRKTMNRT